MKNFFIFLFVALGAVVASAQVPTYGTQTIPCPIVAGGSTSNSIFSLISCQKQQNVPLQLTITGCTNWTMNFSASVDGLTFDTNHYSITGTNATVGQTIVTNLAVAGIGYVRLDSFTSTGTINATNSFTYGVKISSP